MRIAGIVLIGALILPILGLIIIFAIGIQPPYNCQAGYRIPLSNCQQSPYGNTTFQLGMAMLGIGIIEIIGLLIVSKFKNKGNVNAIRDKKPADMDFESQKWR
jgi:hypothetical protein